MNFDYILQKMSERLLSVTSNRPITSIEKYDNGQIKYINTYENGKMNGVFMQFYENGNLQCEGTYKNYKRDGFMRGFYENGTLRCQFTISNDTIHDDYEEYDEDGNPSRELYDTGIEHNVPKDLFARICSYIKH